MRFLLCFALWPLALAAEQTEVTSLVIAAELVLPTDRYDHGVLGDSLEWGGLQVLVDVCQGCATPRTEKKVIILPNHRVFEDFEARVADFDGDGRPEVMVVETDLTRGASLAIYDGSGKRAATAFIGTTHRWLAPAGWGDFDSDGRIEIAYVDRPHLRRELVFVRYADGKLTEIARAAEFTNHRIGDAAISGGTRHCNGRDSLIVASGDWTGIAEITLVDTEVSADIVSGVPTAASLRAAMDCAN